MTMKNREFTFEETEDGRIVAEDKEGYPVTLDLGHVTEKNNADELNAAWENLVCPVIYQKLKQSDGSFPSNNLEVSMTINECAENLIASLQDDVETGSIDEYMDSEAMERQSRVLIEYLIEFGVVEYDGAEVTLMPDPQGKLSDINLTSAGEEVVDLFLKWTGTLDLVQDDLEQQSQRLDSRLNEIESTADSIAERRENMEERINEARNELWNITDGRKLKPDKEDGEGFAIVAPKELTDEQKRERWKKTYNRVVRMESSTPGTGEDLLGGAISEFDKLQKEIEKTQDEINYQKDQIRFLAGLAHDTTTWDLTDTQDLLSGVHDLLRNTSKSVGEFVNAAETVQQVSVDDVYGGEPVNDKINKAEEHLKDSQKASKEARNKGDELEDTFRQIGEEK